MPSVLFVCSANICRSPMAMGLFRKQVSTDKRDWKIESAGVWAQKGDHASDFAQIVMEKRGIDIRDHQSQPVTRELSAAFNLILTMERRHKDALSMEFPAYANRIYLLREMVGNTSDILDPYGMALPDYEETAKEIDQILQEGFYLIQYLSDGNP